MLKNRNCWYIIILYQYACGVKLINELLISAAIVSYNCKEQVVCACKSVAENTVKYPFDFYVFDNASSDGTADAVKALGCCKISELDKNIGFGAAHNKILDNPLCKYHFVINPDITLNGDVLSDMVDFMEQNPDIVMAMPSIKNPDGSPQYLPKEKPTFKKLFLGRLAPLCKSFAKIRSEYVWQDKEISGVTDIDFCSGCFFCIRSDVFAALGGFDERFFMYLEDADLTLRAKKFGRTVIAPQFSVFHAWQRESSKKLKYLLIHISSCIKFLLKTKKEKS